MPVICVFSPQPVYFLFFYNSSCHVSLTHENLPDLSDDAPYAQRGGGHIGRKAEAQVSAVGEAFGKSISINILRQALRNKQGLVWTAARVDVMVWLQMAFSNPHCPLASCTAFGLSACGLKLIRAPDGLKSRDSCWHAFWSSSQAWESIVCFVPSKRMIVQVLPRLSCVTHHQYSSSVFIGTNAFQP